MTNTSRQQKIVERIVEDEALRGDLEDSAATALVKWASDRAGTIAADASRTDADVDAAASAIRTAARQAANSGETEPERVVAQAEAIFAKQAPAAQAPPSTTNDQPAAKDQDTATPAAAPDRAETPQASAPANAKPQPTDEHSSGVEAPTLPPAAESKPKATTSKRRKTRRQRSRKKSK